MNQLIERNNGVEFVYPIHFTLYLQWDIYKVPLKGETKSCGDFVRLLSRLTILGRRKMFEQ